MIDGSKADDKIIAVLEADVVYGKIQDISEVPVGLIDRLRHYFLSYKQLPGEAPRRVEIAEVSIVKRLPKPFGAAWPIPSKIRGPGRPSGPVRRLLHDTWMTGKS